MPTLYINTDAVVKFTNKLEQLSKSALPVVIRQTLNSAGYDLKKNTMPVQADKAFTIRQANFFKVTSHVDQATGFDINTMNCKVGFTGKDRFSTQAVAELQEQEMGGDIAGRSFIPLSTARKGVSNANLVETKNRLTNIQKIVNARNARGANKAQQFIKAAIQAGKGGYVIAEDKKGQNILWRVNSLKRNKNWATRMDLTPLYSFTTGRKVQISKTEFMEVASNETAKRIDEFYITNAKHKLEAALQ